MTWPLYMLTRLRRESMPSHSMKSNKLQEQILFIVIALVAAWFSSIATAEESARVKSSAPALHWSKLAPIPDAEGLGFPFAGVADDALLVAGGANFPNGKPWESGTKVWHDPVFALQSRAGTWKQIGKLPRPLAYGVSITTPDGVACLGGSDATRHYTDCFLMQWNSGNLRFKALPSLPKPCANFTGVLVNRTIYVAGGVESPDAISAMRTFWSLNLARDNAAWQELKPWPGEGRMFATMGEQGGAIYLFGGAALDAGKDGKPVRRWLRDAFRYSPNEGWQRVADLPRPVVAAPTPAPAWGKSQLLLLGGDDGAQASAPPERHSGFPREVLAYDTIADKWTRTDRLPFSFATTPTVQWENCIIVPGGEVRPGIRSNQVWAGAKRGGDEKKREGDE